MVSEASVVSDGMGTFGTYQKIHRVVHSFDAPAPVTDLGNVVVDEATQVTSSTAQLLFNPKEILIASVEV